MTTLRVLSRSAAIALTVIMASCHTPSVLLSPEFSASAESYPVKGRQGVMINQKLSFGHFRTQEVNRGWLRSYDIPFIIRFSGASEKLSFTLTDSLSTVHAHCLGKVRRQEFQLVHSYFGITLKEEDAFAGNLSVAGGKNWDFIVHNASNSNALNAISGFMRSGDEQIEISAIRKMEGKNTFLSELGVYGYEFRVNGKVIGAVDTMNKGKVYFSSQIGPEQRALVAGMSAALLLKTDLGS